MKTMIIKGVERLMEISTVSTIKRAKTDGAEYHRLLKRTLASQRGVINLVRRVSTYR